MEVIQGEVYVVGAGPGDPELLTVKASRLIRAADLILHDDLVAPAILALAGLRAKIVNVGKRCGIKGITQAEINALMIASARRGLKVVRLHGGDPSIFGRIAEELDALEEAPVPFEIVPGITAGAAAAAVLGFSLTDRRKSSRVIIVSGHRATKNAPETTDWKEVAREEATLVIYMPGNQFSGIREELLAAGLTPEIPAVIISRVTTPEQQSAWTTLGELEKLPHMESPAVLLIGWPLDSAKRRFSQADASTALQAAELILSSV